MRPRLAVQIASFVIALAALPAPASAQGFFDWFNQRQDDRYARQNSWSGQRQNSWSGHQQRYSSPQVSAYSDPSAPMDGAALWRAEHALDRRRRGTLCRLLRAAVRRAPFPDAAPQQRHLDPALQRVLPGREDAGVQRLRRSTTRSPRTARATPTWRTRSSTARRSFRIAPATARTRSGSPKSTSRPTRP